MVTPEKGFKLMKTRFKVLKWLGVGLVALVVVLQFVRPARTNPRLDYAHSLESHLEVPTDVDKILSRSCNDCHSNNTRWPWYSHVAPVSWFVIDHVNHGRSHLNFSDWGNFSKRDAELMLTAICKEVKSGSMPLTSYTRIHREARLSLEDVRIICDWTTAQTRPLSDE